MTTELDDTSAIQAALAERLAGDVVTPIRRQNVEGDEAYAAHTTRRIEDFGAALPLSEPRSIKILILGSCLTQLTAEFLEQRGPQHGLRVETLTAFPQDTALIGEWQPDVVVLQLSAEERMLAPLWDQAPFLEPDERRMRLDHLESEVAQKLEGVLQESGGRLLLVLGFSTPSLSPLGLYDAGRAPGHVQQEPTSARSTALSYCRRLRALGARRPGRPSSARGTSSGAWASGSTSHASPTRRLFSGSPS